MATKKDFLVAGRIQIIRIAFTCDKSVQLLDHHAQSVKFVLELGAVNE
jgi:hypothetical protein